MSDIGIGKLITTPQNKDAVHMAVVPAEAVALLSPGEHVGFVGGSEMVGPSKEPIGIVDPFLKKDVCGGETFWLFLYPGSITSLRHDWTHPAFPEVAAVSRPAYSASEQWIRDFADKVGLGYNTLMDGAVRWVATHDGKWSGDYLNMGGLLAGESVPKEFWGHYEAVTKTEVPEIKKGSFFTCSCS